MAKGRRRLMKAACQNARWCCSSATAHNGVTTLLLKTLTTIAFT